MTLRHLLTLLLIPTNVGWAWGTIGHELVANLAWNRLTTETQEWVMDVLGDHDADQYLSPLAAVADWADRVRIYKHWSASLHYIDVRDDLITHGCHANDDNKDCHFDYVRDCPQDRCVAGAVQNYTNQLLSTPSSFLRSTMVPPNRTQLQREALMFLTHFIGDIHQPLHCSRTTDKGGNDLKVHWNTSFATPWTRNHWRSSSLQRTTTHHHGWNLHSVWDSGIIEMAMKRFHQDSQSQLEQDLAQQIQQNPSTTQHYLKCSFGRNQTCTEQWGEESWTMALNFAYTLGDNQTDVVNGSVLTQAYFDTRWPMVRQRLVAGGIRLAATLEQIVNPNKEPEPAVWIQLARAIQWSGLVATTKR